MTHQEYLAARKQLDELNAAIDAAPMSAKPVFAGIVELHDKVKRYEQDHK